MTSIYDFASTAIFIVAVALFFYRLQRQDEPLWPYVGISIGCAIANWAGDEGYHIVGGGALFLALASVIYLAKQPLSDPQDP